MADRIEGRRPWDRLEQALARACALGVAACLAIGAGAVLAQEGRPDWSKPDTVEALRADLGELTVYIETHFSQDYDDWIGQLTQLMRDGLSEEELVYASAELTATIRMNHVHMMTSVPDDSARDLVGKMGGLIVQVLDEQGPEICARYAMLGPMALVQAGVAYDYSDELNDQVLTFLTAVVAARDAPQKHDPVTNRERTAFFDRLIERGMTDAQFDALETLDGSDPLTCEALALYIDTIKEPDLPNGPVLRAEYLQLSFGYDLSEVMGF